MSFLKVLAKGLAIWIGIYVAQFVWENHKVSGFCGDLHPGMMVESIQGVASAHGIDSRWLKGLHDEKRNVDFFFVPIAATMGERACSVTHDGKSILTARMTGP